MVAYLNGTFLPMEEAKVPIEDRGYQFADGIYEVVLLRNGKLAFLDAHLDRLWRSAGGLEIALPWDRSALKGLMDELMRRDGRRDGALYMQVTRGVAPRDHRFPDHSEPTTVMYLKDAAAAGEAQRNGVKAVTVEDSRWLDCWIKSVSLLPNILARQAAVRQGGREAILVRQGIASECSSSNFAIVRGGTLLTHPADRYILNGITRQVVLECARSEGIPVEERSMTVAEVFTADEAFYTSTTSFVMPIVDVDGKPIADGKPGPVTRRLQEALERALSQDVGETAKATA